MTGHETHTSVRIVGTLRLPTFQQLWREWRCSRKHEHGPGGFYPPDRIVPFDRFRDTDEHGLRIMFQECQACGRCTVWSEEDA